ncbi:MAG: phosphopentomutase, partial [candidate division Zixibacteria bacterium]|nr:phosphopentomutase [candidate division Zixibacteria bacterium]
PTVAIGKIDDLFAHRGISKAVKATNNIGVMKAVRAEMATVSSGLIFANLVDFDMLWGHRNDVSSFAKGLEEFDRYLPNLLDILRDDDLLIITADHGCDPTLSNATDHTREYVPLLAYNKKMKAGIDLGIRETFADVGQTIAEVFGIEYQFPGKSFLKGIAQSIG